MTGHPGPQQPDEDARDQRMLEALNRGMPADLAALAIYGPDGYLPAARIRSIKWVCDVD